MQSKVFSTNKTLVLSGRPIDLAVPKVMGILNLTPDSFYDGGRFSDEKSILQHAGRMLSDGAAILDLGGYSTRPNADDIPIEEELQRVVPVCTLLKKHFPEVNISIDTFRAEVARQCVLEGACMVNDVSGGDLDASMFPTVAQLNVPYVLTHMRGTPQTMNSLTHYDDLIEESMRYFISKIGQLRELHVKDVILDPGFGFAKSVDQNFKLLKDLDQFKLFGLPILAGLSRKSLIWRTLKTDASGALNGTTSLNTLALIKGTSLLRVHDVKEAVESINLMIKAGLPE